MPVDKQRQLITAAYQCCIGVGLVSGVFNIQLKMTTTGPRLIEINARMAGYCKRDWLRTVFSVDILLLAFMVACDIRPVLPRQLDPLGQLVSIYIVPSDHRQALSDQKLADELRQLHDKGVAIVTPLVTHLPATFDDIDQQPYASVDVMACDAMTALTRVVDVFDQLGLNTPECPVDEVLADFKIL